MYSIPMALVDFIPVILFGMAIFILQRDLYNKMSKGAYALFCAGTIDVFMAGILKALYKLLYAANICNFERLNAMFLPLQAIGFIMAGFAMICMIYLPQSEKNIYAVTPVVFSGTFIFILFMVLGLFGIDFSLIVLSKRLKKNKLIIYFVISFIFSLMMGYLSSKDFTLSYMNWVAEIVNTIGQGSLFIGVKLLSKSGLNELKIKED